ncbi:hypothetical protein ABPG72_004924 [Tetrahymena utriculariae]
MQQAQVRSNLPKPIYGLHKRLGEENVEQNTKAVIEKYKTYTWDKSFIYNHLDTRLLKSIFLDDNQYFQDCIFLINEYNAEVEKIKKSKEEMKNGPWKMRFYSTLYNLLREVIFTRDRILQRSFAQDVNQWAYKQLEGLEADQKEIKPFDNDPAFMLTTIRGVMKDFSKYRKTSSSRERPVNKSLEKQKTVTFTANTLPNFNDESTVIVNRTFLDESTRDQTILDGRQQSPEKEEQSVLSQSTTHFKVTSILSQAGLRPKMKMPSEYVQEVLKDYNICARTKHPEYEPPAIRLKEYKRRVLSFDDPSKVLTKLADTQKKESEFSRVTYPKPLTLQDMKKKKEEEQQALEEQKREEAANRAAESAAGEIKPEDGQAPAAATPNQEGEKKADDDKSQKEDLDLSGILAEKDDGQPKKPPLQPNIKNYANDEYGKETFIRDLNKKYDHRSNYIYYEPSDDVREIRMENKWNENRQKELKEKRENEEMIKLVQEWSIAKGRLEKEISRKIDSNIYGSKFKECEYRFNKKTNEELQNLDQETKEAALKQNALEEIREIEDKKKRIEQKKKEREERRKEREEKKNKKKRHDTDSDKEKSDEESYDEELDGPFDPSNPKFKNKRRPHSLHVQSKPEQKSVDITSTLPRIAKVQNQTNLHPFKGLEYDTQRQKIEMIKRLHGNLINIKPKNPTNNNELSKTQQAAVQSESSQSFYYESQNRNQSKEPIQPSLSVYSRDVMQKLRPFSAIFEANDLSVIQKEQILEIHEVKNRMAKYKLSVPYKKLKDAIIVPEGLTNKEDLELIPDPGQGLIRNPFMKEKKKKKKKKRK